MIPRAENIDQDNKAKEDEFVFEYEHIKYVRWYDRLLLNRPLKVLIAVLLSAVVAPLLIYQFWYYPSVDSPPTDGYSIGSCLLQRATRLACGSGHMREVDCHPQCCYDRQNDFCFHRLPSRFSYIMDRKWSENVTLQPRVSTVPYSFQNSVTSLRISVDEITPTHMSINFYNAQFATHYGRRLEEKVYEYDISSPEMNVVVNSPQGNIFNTLRGPLIAARNIWEVSFKTTNESMYGLGEIPLREGTVKVIYSNDKDESSVPLIFSKINGSYHGLLIDTSSPTEISILHENQIVVRSITSFGFKFHLFTGPEPEQITKEVMNHIGIFKNLEYWMLGAHVCRYADFLTMFSFIARGKSALKIAKKKLTISLVPVPELERRLTRANRVKGELPATELPRHCRLVKKGVELNCELSKSPEDALDDFNDFMNKASSQRLSYDSHCGALPIVFKSDICNMTEKDVIESGAQLIKGARKRFVPHVSPYIRYERHEETEDDEDTDQRNELNCSILPRYERFLLRNATTLEPYEGLVNDKNVLYLDYESVPEELMKNLWSYNEDVDGMILENNWPLDESQKAHHEILYYLPYFNKNFEIAFDRTPEWNVSLPNDRGKHIYQHNFYGNAFIIASQNMLNRDVPKWSTSQWMNGQIVINRQNVDTSWTGLHKELIAMSLGGVSGHLFWSSPICGDTESFDIDIHNELCIKWYMASTFFPLLKIHSKGTSRDPIQFVGTHRAYLNAALNNRLSLLPYFFTVLQEGPLLRPMFYQYPSAPEVKDLNKQFNVGNDLLIVPNLQPSQTHVHVTMVPGTWYELWGGLRLNASVGEIVAMTTTAADFLILIRGGSIIALQKNTRETAEETRFSSKFSLIAALQSFNSTENITECEAAGHIYMSNNLTIHMEANAEELHITAVGDGFEALCGTEALWSNYIEELNVYGLEDEFNNYDNHRRILTSIDLCDLKETDEINFKFI